MQSCYPSLTNQELVNKFTTLEAEISLLGNLEQIRVAGTQYDFLKQNYILILSKDTNAPLEVHSYKTLPEATIKYFEFERKHITTVDIDIVLVRAPSEENLRVSYKNYFSDTQDFVRLVKEGMQILENS
jgi:hypothetical protein